MFQYKVYISTEDNVVLFYCCFETSVTAKYRMPAIQYHKICSTVWALYSDVTNRYEYMLLHTFIVVTRWLLQSHWAPFKSPITATYFRFVIRELNTGSM